MLDLFVYNIKTSAVFNYIVSNKINTMYSYGILLFYKLTFFFIKLQIFTHKDLFRNMIPNCSCKKTKAELKTLVPAYFYDLITFGVSHNNQNHMNHLFVYVLHGLSALWKSFWPRQASLCHNKLNNNQNY